MSPPIDPAPAQNPPERADCSVYVSSCDAYSDLWPGFCAGLARNWPDCPWPVYLGANRKSASFPGVTTLQSDPSALWSDNVIEHLQQLRTGHILFLLDDFFLRRSVSTALLKNLLDELRGLDGSALRLIPKPPPDSALPHHPLIGECAKDAPYRICVQPTLWNRQDLMAVLVGGESIWDFERRASLRARAGSRRFFATYTDMFPCRGWIFHHVVEKGKWIPVEYLRFKLAGFPVNRSHRGLMRPMPFLLLALAELSNRILTWWFGSRAHVVRRTIMDAVPRPLRDFYRRRRGYPPLQNGGDRIG